MGGTWGLDEWTDIVPGYPRHTSPRYATRSEELYASARSIIEADPEINAKQLAARMGCAYSTANGYWHKVRIDLGIDHLPARNHVPQYRTWQDIAG